MSAHENLSTVSLVEQEEVCLAVALDKEGTSSLKAF